MQLSRPGMWQGYHLLIEGIWKDLFCQKGVYKRIRGETSVGGGGESPRIKVCWVPSGKDSYLNHFFNHFSFFLFWGFCLREFLNNVSFFPNGIGMAVNRELAASCLRQIALKSLGLYTWSFVARQVPDIIMAGLQLVLSLPVSWLGTNHGCQSTFRKNILWSEPFCKGTLSFSRLC